MVGMTRCSKCHREYSYVAQESECPHHFYEATKSICPECGGTGRRLSRLEFGEYENCQVCLGDGIINIFTRQTVQYNNYLQ